MPKITFEPRGRSVDVAPGTGLLEAAARAGVRVASECGGKGACGSCLCLAQGGKVAGDSAAFLAPEVVGEGYVLACRALAGEEDTTLRVPEQSSCESGQFVSEDPTCGEAPAPEPADLPAAVLSLAVEPPRAGDGRSDLDRVGAALEKAGEERPAFALSAMRKAAAALRAEEGRISLALDRTRGRAFRLRPAGAAGHPVGAAVDLGTTTVAAALVDLATGRTLAADTAYNTQTSRGLDVISRIAWAARPGGLRELTRLARGAVNRLLEGLARRVGLARRDITAVSLSGNTTMTHLLLGLPPEHIRLAPYTPTVFAPDGLDCREAGLFAHPAAPLFLAPAVGSYVGGDIASGLLASGVAEAEGLSLFLDLGTNGEAVLGDRDFLLCCACSVGPAFEGGGLSHGMRAAFGAVERVDVDPASGAAEAQTIGGGPALGLCGSGAISLMAGLFRAGWLDPAARLDRSRTSPAIRIDGRSAEYLLVPAHASGTERDITVSETDFDNLLRAKAAVYAGCDLLLARAGLEFADLDQVVVAGGFGRFLDVESAAAIGLLPDLPREKLRFAGNASLAGSARCLLSRAAQARRREIAGRMTYLDLSDEPAYMDRFTAALFLPHTEAARFPGAAARMASDGTRPSSGSEPPSDVDGLSKVNTPAVASSDTPARPGAKQPAGAAAPETPKEASLRQAAEKAAAELAGGDLAARAAGLGLDAPGPDGSLEFRFLERRLRVVPPGYEVSDAADGSPARAAEAALVLHLLALPAPVQPGGEPIAFRELPSGPFYLGPFRSRSVEPLAAAVGNGLDRLRAALAGFDWTEAPHGDFAARIRVLGNLFVTLVHRRGDEEFPPAADLLFDPSARHILDADAAATLASRLCLSLVRRLG
ncbi:MAG: ASKHA domain-containing protein [Thermodesulfobacteriota bacterium]